MPISPTIVWFRQDLRLRDHPALLAAVRRGGPVVPVYIWDEEGEGKWAPGAASRWWLHQSLVALADSLNQRGSRLVVRRGRSQTELSALIDETGAGAVYWNRRYEPAVRRRDAVIKQALGEAGVEARSFNGALLHEPHEISNKQGGPFQVFTPFWRHCLTREVAAPGGRVPTFPAEPGTWPPAREIAELNLLPVRDWAKGLRKAWVPGEAGAGRALQRFVRESMDGYSVKRDFPADQCTSRLSPHLHFGEISPRRIWAEVAKSGESQGVFPPSQGAQVFLKEVGWREFAHHLLYHFEYTPEQPLRAEWTSFPWREDGGRLLEAWQRGQTGYPIVDAGMRELWATGGMHNRVRMVVASFLVKHLRLPWQRGAAWFWDTLVDADLASNTMGWQWSAGCGADAAPYFRIFAPVLQGRKFDGGGAYVRRWVPELDRLPAKYLHAPWEAPAAVLKSAEVELGLTYPRPIVDHAEARAEALAAYAELRNQRHD